MASQYRRRSLMLNTIAKVAQGNPTIITDSSSRRLQKLNIYGQSEQDSTTGAQLLDPSLFESNDITKNGIRFVKNSDGSISVSGTSTGFSSYNLGLNRLENGTYFINGSKNNIYVYMYIKKADSESYIENNSFTIDGTETSIKIYMQINPDFTINDIIYPMLNLGNTAKPFEPYTGGKPSPSPDYPQEIISKEVSEIRVTNGADLSQTVTLTEPITLRGVPVDNGGNVTIGGQQYISDYIDSLTSKVNRLNGYIDSYNGEEVGTIFMSTTGQLTTGAKVIYKLSQPTQEDLPQEAQEAIRNLKTFYPNTVIQTGRWNEVTYSAKRGG